MKLIHNILLAGTLLTHSSSLFAADEASYSKITGTYVGTYRFEMNTTDTMALSEQGPQFPIHTSSTGEKYKTLGYSYNNGLWKWDFDKMKVTWGGTKLYALESFKVNFQIYNQSMAEEKAGMDFMTGKIAETYPHVNSIDDITMDIIDNKDGTYNVDFGKKIHLIMAMYPFGKTTGKFNISLENNELKIASLDYEIDGGELDGVPGARIMGVFPFIVQPSYFSVKMKKDSGLDTNKDGFTDIESEFSGLDKNITDTDNDGISDKDEINVIYAPSDKDEDGIADYLEAGEDANKGYIITKMKSDIDSSFRIEFLNKIPFNGALSTFEDYNPSLKARSSIALVSNKGDVIPKLNKEGVEIRYKELFLNTTQELTIKRIPYSEEPKFKFIFEDGIPDGFDIYFKFVNNGSKDPDTGLIPIANYHKKLPWTKVSNNEILVHLVEDSDYHIMKTPYAMRFIFAMGEKTKAYLVEASVKGIAYNNTGYEGKTLADGSFYYGSKSVVLSVGDVTLGTISNVNKDGKIFIQDIADVERTNITDEKVLKIAQFLYSLDSNLETESIEISDEIFEKFKNTDDNKINILSNNFDLKAVLSENSIDIKPMAEVKGRLTKTLISQGLLSTTKAYFIDSAVEGIQYKNANIEGKTASDGSFDYVNGEVEFFVGDVSIGKLSKINDDGKIFIQDIIGVDRKDIKDARVLKIAQFLQSLDSDSSTNEIEISNETFEKFQENDNTKLDILSNNFNIEEVLSANNIELKEMTKVSAHLNEALVNNNIIKQESKNAASTNNTSSISGGGSSGGSFSWLLLLTLLGSSFFRIKK